jgi:glutathione S-transferase
LYGRSESIRMMLTKAGVPFEDCRLSFAEWPAFKADMMKKSGFGGMPILEFPDGMRMY